MTEPPESHLGHVPTTVRPNPFSKSKPIKKPLVVVPPVRIQPWRTLDRNVMMLAVDRSTDHIAMRKYDKKSAAICVAALAYSHVYSLDQWTPKDISKILDIGQYLHKTTCLRNKSEDKTVRPADIISSFYIDFTKITTLVGSKRLRGDFNPVQTGTDGNLIKNIHSTLLDSIGCILCYDRNKYAAIWSFGGSYYVFYAYDQDSKLVRRQVRQSCCLRLHTVGTMVQFLPKLLNPTISKYVMLSVKILSVQELSKYPEENPLTEVERQWSDKSVAELRVGPTMVQDIAIGGGGGGGDEDDTDNVPFTLPEQFGLAPYLDNFQQAYVPISNGRDILRGFNYSEQNYRIPCMNLAAITMLRITRSFTWTWDTLEEILTLGHEIYDNNRSSVDGPEILATDIKKPISIGRSSFEIACEQAVFGELLSTKEDVPHLDRALQVFFKIYDTGILQGPQSVAVWHELGHYYMFDAKERDKYGRKWTSSMANEFSNENNETVGCCCVTRFRDVEQLVNVYTETVPLKHRRDPFRITRVDVKDFLKRSDNWFNWSGIGIGKWILCGKFCQGNVRFDEDGRDQQATCIAAMALIYSTLKKMDAWNSALIDEILDKGDELHKKSVEELKAKEKFVSQMLCVSEVSRECMVEEQQIELIIEECLINGSLQAKGVGPITGLEAAFVNFFTSSNSCVLISSGISLAIWKNHDYYYMFDSHARDENGRNPDTCRYIAKSGKLGTSCALRFASLSEMTTFIIKNMDQKITSGFNISRLEAIAKKPEEAPPLKKFKPYLVTHDTAILRPSKGIHEGNKTFYDVRAGKQTLCSALTALCMSRLNHSDNWMKSDIVDVLNAADKTFVSITVAQAKRVQDDFPLSWENLVQAGIDIGENRFIIAEVERKTGVLVTPPPPSNTKSSSNEEKVNESTLSTEKAGSGVVKKKRVTVLQPEALANARKSGSKLSRLSMDINLPGKVRGENSSQIDDFGSKDQVPVEPYVAPDDLRSLLADWSTADECESVLETPFFTVALWKQDQKFFMFDPKACDHESAELTEKRIKTYEKLIRIRKEEEAEAARLLADQQIEEVVEPDVLPVSNSMDKSLEKISSVRASKLSQINELLSIREEEATQSSSDIPSDIPPIEPEPEDLDEVPEASCVLLRFTSIDNLIAHLIKLIPEQHHQETITVVQPRIKCVPIDFSNKKYFSFKRIENPVSEPFWMIRASMSQNDQIFQATTNRNRQDAANSITAVSMATFCCAEDWTPVILDVILKYGDRLYSKSLQQYTPGNTTDKNNLYQIISPFVLANVKFSFTVEFYASGDMLAEPGNKNIRSVFDVLSDYLDGDHEKYGVLVTRQYFVSIWRDDKSYYMFDSHEIGPDGKRSTLGVASLFRFTDLTSMAEIVMANLNETTSDFTSFQLYKIKIKTSKMPKTTGLCVGESKKDRGKIIKMVEPKTNSAFCGCQTMRLLHGNMSETCEVLKYNMNPPTACHAVVAMAVSRETNSEFWTPRVIDQILMLGNDLFDLTIDLMDDNKTTFDTNTERLRPQQVRKNFLLRDGKILVHMEMDLYQKGIVNPKESGELSLKSAISRFFASHSYAVIMTDRMIVSVWLECGFFYLFYSQSVNQNGLLTKSDNACLIRFETFMHLYQAIMMNMHVEDESSWFEIRRCDFTLKKVPKGTLVTRTNSTTKVFVCEQENKSKKAARSAKSEMLSIDGSEKDTHSARKRRCSSYSFIEGQQCMFLRGSPIMKSSYNNRALRECQSAAISVMAVALSCVELISSWTNKTIDIIVRSGLEIYRDACSIHSGSFIRLHEIPRKIVIGDVLLNLSILSPIITDSELDEATLVEFFEQHTMAYVVLNRTNCLAIIRLLNQFYLFDPMPKGLVVKWGAACSKKGCDQWAGVLRFMNLQGLYDFLLTHYVAHARAEDGEYKLMLGPIKCVRGHPAGSTSKTAATVDSVSCNI